MDRRYLDWLASLPINRGVRPRRSWVGVFSTEDSFETYEQWQARIDMRDAPRGVIARWKRWMN